MDGPSRCFSEMQRLHPGSLVKEHSSQKTSAGQLMSAGRPRAPGSWGTGLITCPAQARRSFPKVPGLAGIL